MSHFALQRAPAGVGSGDGDAADSFGESSAANVVAARSAVDRSVCSLMVNYVLCVLQFGDFQAKQYGMRRLSVDSGYTPIYLQHVNLAIIMRSVLFPQIWP